MRVCIGIYIYISQHTRTDARPCGTPYVAVAGWCHGHGYRAECATDYGLALRARFLALQWPCGIAEMKVDSDI